MQVKKFEAPTVAEALKLVKTELGPEAIILSTKNNKKGFGLLSKASVEVTAAISEKSLVKKQTTEKLMKGADRDKLKQMPASKQSAIYDRFNDYVDRRRDEQRSKKQSNTKEIERIAKAQRYADIADEPATASVQSPGRQTYARNGQIKQVSAEENKLGFLASSSPSFGQSMTSSTDASSSERSWSNRVAKLDRDIAESRRVADESQEKQMADDSVGGLRDEITQLKSMIEDLKSENMGMADSRLGEVDTAEIQSEFQSLVRNGIERKYASQLIKEISFSLSREQAENREEVVEAIAVELMDQLKFEQPFNFKPIAVGERKVVALVGPTGVGKTTTIAKIASQAILQNNLRVGLINVDSYKVAALDQLATYAKILNVPFRQATNAQELERALNEFKLLDLVLIDTTGRSQRDTDSLGELQRMLATVGKVTTLLIMSTTTRDQELYDISQRFRVFNPSGLIFSKLDESTTFGCVFNMAKKTKLPLTYFTVGQRVPEDLELATKERVADLILDL